MSSFLNDYPSIRYWQLNIKLDSKLSFGLNLKSKTSGVWFYFLIELKNLPYESFYQDITAHHEYIVFKTSDEFLLVFLKSKKTDRFGEQDKTYSHSSLCTAILDAKTGDKKIKELKLQVTESINISPSVSCNEENSKILASFQSRLNNLENFVYAWWKNDEQNSFYLKHDDNILKLTNCESRLSKLEKLVYPYNYAQDANTISTDFIKDSFQKLNHTAQGTNNIYLGSADAPLTSYPQDFYANFQKILQEVTNFQSRLSNLEEFVYPYNYAQDTNTINTDFINNLNVNKFSLIQQLPDQFDEELVSQTNNDLETADGKMINENQSLPSQFL